MSAEIDPHFEAEYNNRARVPEHPGLIAGWAADAAAFRAGYPHEPDIAYGESARQVFDLFLPDRDGGGPACLFIHGGYWQALDKSYFSHMAKGPLAHGLPVAVMSYDLCPAVSIADIVDEARAAAIALHRRLGRPVLAYGHSAGGHLAAILLATDWQRLDPALPASLVPAALAISGLFDLEPLIPTSINGPLGLDRAEARRLSPIRNRAPSGLRLDAVVGGAESREYHRQSKLVVDLWRDAGVRTRYAEIAGANHFTVIASLAEADGVLTKSLVELAGV